jgi:hypothetical protein
MLNELTHENTSFNSELQPFAGSVSYNKAEEDFFDKPDELSYIYTYSAAISLLCDFFDFLKQNNIYDNTKIIIVSDHGKEYANSFFEEKRMERFNPILLIKEQNERGRLKISDKFMTNADAPLAAVSGIVNSYNKPLGKPFIRPLLFSNYDITVCETPGSLKNHYADSFKVTNSRRLLFPDIFKSSSWEDWKEGN